MDTIKPPVEDVETQNISRAAPSVDVDAPPAYTRPSFSATHHLAEDPLSLLMKYNTIVILDDSSSMAGKLWDEVRRST